MVYSNPLITENDNNFTTLGLSTNSKPIKIVYNGIGIHTITGPVPYITMGRKVSANDSGYLNSIPVSMNLNGKIVRNGLDTGLNPPGTGTQSIFGAIENLKNIFVGSGTDSYNGILKILCGGSSTNDGTEIFSASGVRLVNFNAEKTSDNWVTTADYSIDLEFYERKPQDSGLFIKTSTDNWSIEPVEDYIYSNFNYNVTQKSEYHNPLLKPTAPSDSSPVPSVGLGPGNFGTPPTLTIQTIPRFKITRQLSAVGVPIGTGNVGTNSAYKQAKKWVENRLAQSFNNAESGTAYFFQQASIPADFSYLYNHLRTTNFSITAGSYEVQETWLAMPTGLKFTEDYSIETSTDEKYIKTVKVQGEIQGLNLVDLSVLAGTGYLADTPIGSRIDLSSSSSYTEQTTNSPILDISGQTSARTTFSKHKYDNAYYGWLHDVKPYLYRRASLVMDTPDRNRTYINPALATSMPGNPTYCKENLLNVIPVSTTEGHNPRKGTISYTYEFNNKLIYISGTINTNITINDTNPADVIGEAFVLGRRLGPVLQDLGTRTVSKKEVSIELNVLPPSSIGGFLLTSSECPLYTGGMVYTTVEQIIEGLKPFGDRSTTIFGNYDKRTANAGTVYKVADSQSWNPVDGRFSRTVGWTYQQCTNARSSLDH